MASKIDNRLPILSDAVRPPEVEGVDFIEFAWIKVSELKEKYFDKKFNPRVTDVDHNKITEFSKLIKNNTYRHFSFFPPVICLTVNKLVSGYHKFMAHRAQSLEYIFVAFVKTNGSEVNAKNYGVICNAPQNEYVNNPRDQRDIIQLVIENLEEQGYNDDHAPQDTTIQKVYNTLRVQKSEISFAKLLREIKKNFNKLQTLKTYSPDELKEYVHEKYGDQESNKGPLADVSFKNYDKDSDRPWKDDRVWYIESMCHRDDQKNPALRTARYMAFTETIDLEKARMNKKKSIEQIKRDILRAAEIIKHKDFVDPELIFVNQSYDAD